MAYTAVLAATNSRAGRLFENPTHAALDADRKNAIAKEKDLKARYSVGQAEPVNDRDRVHTKF